MRRYISLACVALIVVMCLASPVSAADLEFSNLIQILDYSTANDSGSNYLMFNTTTTVTYSVPVLGDYNYIDMLVYCAGARPTTVSAGKHNTTLTELTIVNVSSYLYRIYGYFTIAGLSSLDISFTTGESRTSWYTITSLQLGMLGLDSYEIESYCQISSYDYNTTIHYVPTDEVNHRTFTGTSNYTQAEYTLFLYVDEIWKKYDYIDFLMLTTVDSITSVSAGFGSEAIPFSLSYIDNDSMTSNQFVFSVRLDLTGFDRTITDLPMVTITGNVITDGTNVISVLGTTGYINNDILEPDIFWLTKISSTLSSLKNELNFWFNNQTSAIVSAIRGEPSDGEALQDGAEQIQDSVDDISKFEQDQQAVLDNNFNVIQDAVSVTGFAAALAFVQRYTEGIFLGMGDFFIVFSLPLFLGLFFYICSRMPGATRWRSRPPKDGDG